MAKIPFWDLPLSQRKQIASKWSLETIAKKYERLWNKLVTPKFDKNGRPIIYSQAEYEYDCDRLDELFDDNNRRRYCGRSARIEDELKQQAYKNELSEDMQQYLRDLEDEENEL